jgi:hypothetical protein
LEALGQCLIWWARPHTGAGGRRNRSGAAKSIPPAEIRCRLAISRGWLELHKSGTFMKLTQSGAGLFAMLSEFQN